MILPRKCILGPILALAASLPVTARAQLITGGESLIEKYNPFRQADASASMTVPDLCHRLDCVSEKLRNDGLVVMKRPDVFSQARMTHFRTDFEAQMVKDLVTFHLVLAARINRLDTATTTSQTSLAASLAAPGTTAVHTGSKGSDGGAPAGASGLPQLPSVPSSGAVAPGSSATLDPNKNAFSSLGVDLSNPQALAASSAAAAMSLGVDPTVYLDEKRRFLEYLNHLRRINHGPDQNDSSGYGLYLVRLPVSITPGECTYQGHGAEFAVTVEHEFPPDFMRTTFRNLVINDLIDELTPVVHELIRSGIFAKLELFHQQKNMLPQLIALRAQKLGEFAKSIAPFATYFTGSPRKPVDARFQQIVDPLRDFILPDPKTLPITAPWPESTLDAVARRFDLLAIAMDRSSPIKKNAVDFRSALQEMLARYRTGQAPTPQDRDLISYSIDNILSYAMSAAPPAVPDSNVTQIQILTDFLDGLFETKQPDDLDLLRKAIPDPSFTLLQNVSDTTKSIEQLRETGKTLTVGLASTRNPKERYPIPPHEVLDIFLKENIYIVAKYVKESLLTKNPRATDVRSNLKQMLQAAFDVMASPPEPGSATLLDEVDFLKDVCKAVKKRDLGDGRPLQKLFEKLAREIEGIQKNAYNQSDHTYTPTVALCWAIAVDAVLLDDALRDWIPRVFAANSVDFAVPDDMHFYVQHEPAQSEANPVFQDFVRLRWPIITFAIDPVAEQQNIADSFTLQRDLQLALSFAFATGQISFSQMNTFRRQLQQSSDTIALNRTVTGFAHGNDTFGFRFTPRFQNPPSQRTNLGVIASQLIGGGPGPDYATKKSKLEPGLRELTATLLVPSFLPTLRMQVSSNWFKLTDPEHLIFHTKRQMERGREVQDLRRAVVDACSTDQYRDADLRVLRAKLGQLDAMLPAQSQIVQLPFENSSSGFELFSDGVAALVPVLSGYDGVDVITKPATASTTPLADIFVYGKYIDLLDTRVIVGGAYVPPNAMGASPATGGFEIISREVVHVVIPSTAQPTLTIDEKTYLEVYLATPTGISNRVLVPYQPATPPPQVAFDLNSTDANSTELDIFYQWVKTPAGDLTLVPTDDPGTVDKKPLKITWDAGTGMAPKTLQAIFNTSSNGYLINVPLPANSGTKDDYAVDRQVLTVCLLNELKKTVAAGSALPDPLTVTISVQPYLPLDSMGYRVLSKPKQLKTTLTLRLIPKTGVNALPDVVVPLPPPPPPKPDAATLRRATPGENAIRQTSLKSGEALRSSDVNEGSNQAPIPFDLPAFSSPIQGVIPPLPASLITAESLAASRLPANAAAAVNPAQITALLPPLPTLPPIVVHSSPVTVVAPTTVIQPKSHSRLSRLLHRQRDDRTAGASSSRQ
jgi:hypothetical protein